MLFIAEKRRSSPSALSLPRAHDEEVFFVSNLDPPADFVYSYRKGAFEVAYTVQTPSSLQVDSERVLETIAMLKNNYKRSVLILVCSSLEFEIISRQVRSDHLILHALESKDVNDLVVTSLDALFCAYEDNNRKIHTTSTSTSTAQVTIFECILTTLAVEARYINRSETLTIGRLFSCLSVKENGQLEIEQTIVAEEGMCESDESKFYSPGQIEAHSSTTICAAACSTASSSQNR